MERAYEMPEWNVVIETARRPPDIDEQLDDILDTLAPQAGALTVHPMGLRVRLNVETHTLDEAFVAAMDLFKVVFPGEEAIRFEVQTVEELENQLAESNALELLGVTELARTLGVTRTRASQLTRHGTFPAPAAMLASGPVWYRRSVARFLAKWDRSPGRRKGSRQSVGGENCPT
jgi:hypothetical protein